MQYQCFVTDETLFSVSFVQAIEYLLASKIAPALIHGTSGLQIGNVLNQMGMSYLEFSAGQDAQQGASSVFGKNTPYFIQGRF